MDWNSVFFINSIFLGAGLAMDAFSVSLANGLNETDMKKGRMSRIAGVFSFFQWLMPMIGWVCVHTIVSYFSSFEKMIPWTALILLVFIGSKMIIEGVRDKGENPESSTLRKTTLFIQGVATSIDALSVGFTIAEYGLIMAFVCAFIIGAITFMICFAGLCIGKKFGTHLAGKASIIGGIILIAIGVEIFIKGII